jgi:hypothetical protein
LQELLNVACQLLQLAATYAIISSATSKHQPLPRPWLEVQLAATPMLQGLSAAIVAVGCGLLLSGVSSGAVDGAGACVRVRVWVAGGVPRHPPNRSHACAHTRGTQPRPAAAAACRRARQRRRVAAPHGAERKQRQQRGGSAGCGGARPRDRGVSRAAGVLRVARVLGARATAATTPQATCLQLA